MITNKQVAKEWLKHAINYKNSEYNIREYIRFMDTLPQLERESILLDPDITVLIDVINKGV